MLSRSKPLPSGNFTHCGRHQHAAVTISYVGSERAAHLCLAQRDDVDLRLMHSAVVVCILAWLACRSDS